MAAAALEEWRRLADTATGTFLCVAYEATVAGGLLGSLASVHAKLTACLHLITALRAEGRVDAATARGVQAAMARGVDGPLGGRFPSADLDAALRELARLDALHAVASNAFILTPEDDVLALTLRPWQAHHARALHHAAGARQRLLAAAARTRAFEDAVNRARASLLRSPDWHASMSVAQRLATYAAVTVTLAFYAVRDMRNAVTREFFDTWMALNFDRM